MTPRNGALPPRSGTPSLLRGPVSFVVHGTPAPAGSKRGFYNAKAGRVIITDASEKSRPWKALVSDAAVQAMTYHSDEGMFGDLPPLTGPLLVEFTFWMPRPKSHFGTGKREGVLKPNAPRHHTGPPDVLKLARAVEDAMQGIVYMNDSQIACEILQKPYGSTARCEVRVVPIEQTTVDPEHRGDVPQRTLEEAMPAA